MQNVMNVSYDTKIPNNVNLSSDRRVLKALENGTPAILTGGPALFPSNSRMPMYICAPRSGLKPVAGPNSIM